RAVEGALTADDREHAATCAACGPVILRASRFDEELRLSARSLVVEDLPRGVLDPGLAADGFRVRRPLPGLAPATAVVLLLLLATTVAIWPGSPPTPTPTPAASASAPAKTLGPHLGELRPTPALRIELQKLGYRCNDGMPLTSPKTGPLQVWKESAVCEAPESIGAFMAAVIVGESARGQVVQYTV